MTTNQEKRRVIAEKVMGWTFRRDPKMSASNGTIYYDGSFVHCWEDDIGPTKRLWDPFTDPQAMVEVMVAMESKGVYVWLHPSGVDSHKPVEPWMAEIDGTSIRIASDSPVEAVAEAAYQWAISKKP